MRLFLSHVLLCLASVLSAEEALITYGGQTITVTLPALAHGAAAAAPRLRAVASDIEIHDALIVSLRAGTDALALAGRHQLVAEKTTLPHVWRMSAPGDVRAAIAAAAAMRAEPGVAWVEQEVSAPARVRVDITPQQWHLLNDGTVAGTLGNDLNVAGAWAAGASGAGVNIAVVDSGMDMTHPDLLQNLRTNIDVDVLDNDANPSAESVLVSGRDAEAHATMVAGIAAARGDNGFGVTGVAYRAGIIAVRLITGVPISNSQKAKALGWLTTDATLTAGNRTDVSNNSWGPDDNGIDNGAIADAPSSLENAAMAAGVSVGREGKGAVYIFAAGNGRSAGDSIDFDGYASNRLVMAIGASNATGHVASFSESGFSLFANAPVDDMVGMASTDRQGLNKGFNLAASPAGDYTTTSQGIVGTSFAAPQAAGVVALMLEKNPALTWRDVRHIIARTAVQIQPAASSWRTLPAPPGSSTPLHWSHDFGFGRIDASAAVAAADPLTWVLLPAQSEPLQATSTVQQAIPDGTGVAVGGDMQVIVDAHFRVEEVEFAMAVTHADQSQLKYSLISPAGTRTDIVGRPLDVTPARTRVFTTLAHWGEGANGTWRVEVADRITGTAGTVDGVAISIFGYRDNGASGNSTTNESSGGGTAGLLGNSNPPGSTTSGHDIDRGNGDGGLCGLGGGSLAWLASGWLLVLFGLRRNMGE